LGIKVAQWIIMDIETIGITKPKQKELHARLDTYITFIKRWTNNEAKALFATCILRAGKAHVTAATFQHTGFTTLVKEYSSCLG
jgi:hypothetical protein